MNQIVNIENVKIGMYLLRISACSTNLEVKSQGLIKSSGTIASLKRRGVESIEIDLDKSVHAQKKSKAADSTNDVESDVPDVSLTAPRPKPFVKLTFEQQQAHLAKADKLYTQARSAQTRFMKQLRTADSPDFDALNHVCQDIIDSVFENPEALSCLVMLKDTNDYLVEHSLNCSILMSLFARHRNFSQADIEDFTMAGLLMDVGMTLLPQDLGSRSDEFSPADIVLMQTHVDIGIEVIERFADVPPMVYDIIKNHHERIDGSGYPKQKTAEQISEYAQMAGIVDCYDAMITDRAYRSSMSSQEVLETLSANPAFSSDLVQSFIEAIGLYPVGSLVHLKSEKLAIVVQKHKDNPLKPRVMSFYSIRNKHHAEVKIIDLTKSSDKILGAVRPEEFDLNLSKFFKSVLFQG
ncbi:HD-GYP domain-containing protein [Glaciecola siphonariae]|uniref:HD-GYP domain-containing protein n=1 Tax=Glaciecola siphonariae TaxID=521012 RepID=A0ABV9LZH6_9ALTE